MTLRAFRKRYNVAKIQQLKLLEDFDVYDKVDDTKTLFRKSHKMKYIPGNR